MNRYLSTFLLFLFAGSLHAASPKSAAPLYQVEMIIFQTTALRGWTEEFWPWPESLQHLDLQAENSSDHPVEPPLIHTKPENSAFEKKGETPSTPLLPPEEETPWSLTDLLNGLKPEQAPFWVSRIQPVTPEHYLLKTALTKLVPERGYRIISHLAWQQPALPSNISKPLAIDAATETGDLLSGTVWFYKNRYAHIRLQLTLERIIPKAVREAFAQHEGIPLQALPESWPFYLEVQRKIKSGPWYYIDHPIYGVLLTIQKIQD